ncbi:MAG: META domain-containing protein [Chlorobi bacterium]|nr:META domain-containing protein [Chlorobiota bacterium]
MNKIGFIFIFLLGFTACKTTKNLSGDNFYNKLWTLEKINALNDEENALFSNAGLKFSEADSVYSGSNGCNMISGKFILTGHKISFSEGLSTKRFCKGIDEQKFHEVLRNTETIKINKGKLYLVNRETVLAVFKPKQYND